MPAFSVERAARPLLAERRHHRHEQDRERERGRNDAQSDQPRRDALAVTRSAGWVDSARRHARPRYRREHSVNPPGAEPIEVGAGLPSVAMKAQRTFTVRPHLPEPLHGLDRLASNLRWSWDRPTRELFAMIDPTAWEDSAHDPRRVLADVAPGRLEQLAADASFLERLAAAEAALDAYVDLPRWFQRARTTAGR